ncbi:hypothetical protein ACSBR2_031930 [Camellia fascicularis]
METKNKHSVLERLRRSLRFNNSTYVDPVGLAGGFALWWTDEIDIDVRSRNQNLLHCVLSHHGISWLATFIHALPMEQIRNLFWDSIRTIASENQFPWLCMGDFNEIGAFWEKSGGTGPIARRILGFQQFLQECALMDLEFKGHGFTKCAPSSQCPARVCPVESIEHLLFHCPWTRSVWFGSDIGIRVDMHVCNSVAEWTYSLMNMCSNKSEQLEIIGKVAMVGWCIWKSQNDWVFNHNPLNPTVTMQQATAAWRELYVLNHLGARQPNTAVFEPPSRRWSPPGLGQFKLNCDASFTKDGTKASLAVILRNREGQLVDGRTSIVHVSSTLQGEARAVRMACDFSQTLNLRQVSVEGDNKTVIELSVSELVPPWDCMTIIHDIRSAKSRSNISFSWSPRSSNRVAHWVASRNLIGMLPLD